MATARPRPTGRPKQKVTQYTVRRNYKQYEWWTPAEAARHANRGTTSVRQWMYDTYAIRGRMRFTVRFRSATVNQTSDRINRDTFMEYVATGIPQGETVSAFRRKYSSRFRHDARG